MIALFGGTFNPVHNGHIALAREVSSHFKLEKVDLLPSYFPVHRREPGVSADMRSRMVELAVAPYPELRLNRIEIDRSAPSYTVDTLRELKRVQPDQPICWMMGSDAFNDFNTWKEPEEILNLAHLIVCARPGVTLRADIFADHRLPTGTSLLDSQDGKIAFFAMRPNRCSATEIRKKLTQGLSSSECLPAPVLDFIRQQHLYEN